AMAGWEPVLAECARCGEPGPHPAFSVPVGGAVCATCRPAGAVTPRADTVHLMRSLLVGDWPAAEGAGPAVRREASGLIAAHLQWHLESGLRSLPLVERR
ncbi:MAG TPA: DNA repair protein RecO C-terminal domain-containing protein, partial [Mycobacteriales bacterium]|nr:DNA repair protein RecO C-terminal domain-containing protein [Mycobacteriales bacterium]